jgi:integrase
VLPQEIPLRLETSSVAKLSLGSKRDAIFFDDDLTGFGHRLRLASNGRTLRSWIVQYRAGSRTRRVLLGAADVLTAKQAREAAKAVLAKVTLGQDPAGERADRASKDRVTFKALADQYLAWKETQVRASTFRATKNYLSGDYFRPLHAKAIDSVSRKDVAACILAATRKHGMAAAALARAALSAFFTWDMQQGFAEANPVIGTAMPKQNAPRDRILSDAELSKVWLACDDSDFGRIVRLLILTGCRRSEVGGMAWSELDFEGGSWTIPKERSKNARAHVLPLMPLMLKVLDGVPQRFERDQLFGERFAGGFSQWDQDKSKFDQQIDISEPWRLHDIRRSVATKMADIGIAPHIIETILNHVSGHKSGVAGIYNRSSYEREVRAALALWEDHINALVSGKARRVIPLHA